MPTLLAMFLESPMSMLIIGGVMLLLFGNRLPSVMRSLGEGIVEFKKGVNGVPDDDAAPRKRIDDEAPRQDSPKQEAH